MRLSKTTEYAIRILTFMTVNGHTMYSSMYLHKELDIPYKYMTKLMLRLEVAGFVTSHKGRTGGYSIAKKLSEIYLYQIVETLEGLGHTKCILGFAQCSDHNPCALHKFWLSPLSRITEMMDTVTLQDLKETAVTKL